jgi:hypothetical protein
VSRALRQIERINLDADDVSPVVVWMSRLTDAGDGWINLVPRTPEGNERPTALGFFALFSGGGSGTTMCTWIPATPSRRGPSGPSLGITHVAGRRVAAELGPLGMAIPETWSVEQDHPRRGLILRLPSDEDDGRVLEWALRAADALGGPEPIGRWRADIHLPLAS